ncbi:MAG: HK97 gp10 family phage protein [Candidatus Saccharibacteria bacterium]|nr:HK97 gp10 family phage protein [Candidatus Saccharibacteria bacterium]
MGVSINVKGIGLVKSRLNKLPTAYTKAIVPAMAKATAVVEAGAKAVCPVDSGTLKGSINSNVEQSGNEIIGVAGTSVEYAPYVEFGTGRRGGYPYETNIQLSYGDVPGQAAQPFLGRSLHDNKSKVKDILHKSMRVQI